MARPIRVRFLLGAGLVLSLMLSACSPVIPAPAPSSPVVSGAASSAAASSAAPSPGANASAGPSQSLPVADGPVPSTLTPPGARLKLSEKALVFANSVLPASDSGYFEATLSMTVSRIVAGNPADLLVLKNSARYSGQTPYYVYVNMQIISTKGDNLGLLDTAAVSGLLADGSVASQLDWGDELPTCPYKAFPTVPEGNSYTHAVGAESVVCTVFLAPAGDALTGATYKDDLHNYPNLEDNRYLHSPISWG
ncbi:hypothetical protein [Psychromicrobium xiongbiense]|uniref:hypothetical protein n=1 Tax=Psychromicrobium xiongbiense TaxID=3051184 RepID=UPI0025571D32|nr:hypothetical protein [Psychromicrobium sp. YIM S02556]